MAVWSSVVPGDLVPPGEVGGCSQLSRAPGSPEVALPGAGGHHVFSLRCSGHLAPTCRREMNAEGKPAVLPASQLPPALPSGLNLGAVLPDQDRGTAGPTSKDSEGPDGMDRQPRKQVTLPVVIATLGC